jgi:phosphatidylserine/phosphatidylglycerophosphate/cardiolipin synthase-like enzyme
MLRRRQARSVCATLLITPALSPGADQPVLGPFSSELAEVLAQHVQVADIHDERSFYEVFSSYLSSARQSIWIWSPWTAKRVRSLLPVFAEAAARNVRITLFVRDPGDQLQRGFQQHLAELREVLTAVVEVNVMHQKIVVIDKQLVLLGSLNTLSQSWTREVMLAMRGAHFARKLLEHENAEAFARPPRCAVCQQSQIDLRRRRSGEWYWRCYAPACQGTRGDGRERWVQRVTMRSGSSAGGQAGTPPSWVVRAGQATGSWPGMTG